MSIEKHHPIDEASHPVYRTTTERTVKMMIIMLGICLVGGIILFSIWDYLIVSPAPVVAFMVVGVDYSARTATNGKIITQGLTVFE